VIITVSVIVIATVPLIRRSLDDGYGDKCKLCTFEKPVRGDDEEKFST
jgi:hypothetical protein